MGLNSSTITQAMTVRSASAPSRRLDGMTWIDVSGSNTERKTWNADAGAWELNHAIGPDTPSHAVEGSLWSDTSSDTTMLFDGASWTSTMPLAGANLANNNGTFDVVQGDGSTLDADTIDGRESSDVGPWIEDSNSPWSLASVGSTTLNLADAYDEWRITLVGINSDANNGDTLEMYANGQNDYVHYVGVSGTYHNRTGSIPIAENNTRDSPGNVEFRIDGRWVEKCGVQVHSKARGDQNDIAQSGTIATSGPLSSVTLSSATTFSATVVAEGRDY